MTARWRVRILGAFLSALTAVLLALLAPARPLDLVIHDRLVGIARKVAPLPYAGPEVAIVGFDEEFLSRMPEPFALVHVRLRQVLSAIAQAKPITVAIDLGLPSKAFGFLAYREKPEINFDVELTRGLAALKDIAPVVLAVAWNPGTKQYDEILPSFVAAATWPWEAIAGTTQGRDPRASITVCRDPDGKVRSFPNGSCQPVTGMPSLANRILEAMGQIRPDEGMVNFAIGAPFRYVPVSALIAAHEARDSARLQQLVGNKIVLVAAILNYSDRLDFPVPLSAWEPDTTNLPGVLFHAQAVRTLLANAVVTPLPAGVLLVLALLLSGLWFCPGLLTKLAAAVGIILLMTIAGWLLLPNHIFFPVATLSMAGVLPLLYRLTWDIRALSMERAFLTAVFRGSVSPKVLDGILSGTLDPKRRGARVHVHVMFADIRGFTKLSERGEPERVIRILNAYLAEATQAVHNVKGTIDKFLGDGVLAVFGAPEPVPDGWNAAITAARDLLARVKKLNNEHADCRITPLEVGIGIHAGEAIVGFVGSRERNEFTSIGDTVNVASRIQDLTSQMGYPIITSVDALPHGGRLPGGQGTPLGPHKIKGHADIDIVGFQP